MEVVPLGDSALLLRFEQDFTANPERALQAVRAAQERVQAAALPGVIECAPAYDSLGVFYDPVVAVGRGAPADGVFEWLEAQLRSLLDQPAKRLSAKPAGRLIEIPVCYADEFAPDLPEVAEHTGLAKEEVVRQHNSAHYLVAAVGFLPGFGYLAGLPSQLATPRRAAPRKEVPAGAVAIGGRQTGVYPTVSPGGWNIIGRTPLKMFDAQAEPPARVQAGDSVRFRSISPAEFEQLRA